MKLVLMSDTHELHDQVQVPDGDVLVHAGDFTMVGEIKAIKSFNDWLGKQPHPIKIVIPGNHDKLFEKNEQLCRSLITNARVLIDESVFVQGLRFYGMPWTPTFGYGWAYNANSQLMGQKVSAIPDDTDVLISHGPPKHVLDQTYNGDHAGSPALLHDLSARLHPKVVVFGHIHEGYGRCADMFNASICNLAYQPVNKPFVFEI